MQEHTLSCLGEHQLSVGRERGEGWGGRIERVCVRERQRKGESLRGKIRKYMTYSEKDL